MTTIGEVGTASRAAFKSTWSSVAAGLWVGSTNDEFVGTVELDKGEYVAVDWCGVTMDRWDTLAEAQRQVERPFLNTIFRPRQSQMPESMTLRNIAVASGMAATAVALVALLLSR